MVVVKAKTGYTFPLQNRIIFHPSDNSFLLPFKLLVVQTLRPGGKIKDQKTFTSMNGFQPKKMENDYLAERSNVSLLFLLMAFWTKKAKE